MAQTPPSPESPESAQSPESHFRVAKRGLSGARTAAWLSGARTAAWLPHATALVWLIVGADLACSDNATPRADSSATDPSAPPAMNADPSNGSTDPTATPTGNPTDAPSPVPPAGETDGYEGETPAALDPGASGSTGVAAGGASAAAGAGATAGGAAGAGSEGAGDVLEPDPGTLLGTATRPQLGESAAPQFDVLQFLASAGNLTTGLVRDNWDPTGGVGDVASFSADFRVAASGGTHTSVQAAVTAAASAGGTERRFVEVAAGTYREVVCVPGNAPPITLYATNADASQTVIVFDNYSGKPKAAGTSANPCNPNTNGTTFGTSGSATFAAFAPEFHAKNLTFVNDTDETTATGGVQGVALMGQGDRQIYENVRVLGNQDSLFLKTPDVTTVQRAYFKGCFVEGDTDFIFGRSTFVLDGCTIRSLTSRTANGVVLAPSTDSRNFFGILVTRSTFTADATAGASSTSLGRAWDESQVDVPTYTANVQSGVFPNGQAVVRESTLGLHIQSTTPWRAAATTSRPYASVDGAVPANRFYEFGNTGPGAAPAP